MSENENLQPSGATSPDVPAGGGSTAGAAPGKIKVYVSSEHTLEENIAHARDIAERLDSLVIANQPHSVLTLDTSALSLALRLILDRYHAEVTPPAIPPAPGGDNFAAVMERERASSAAYFSDLLDTIGPKVIAFAKQVWQELGPLDQAARETAISAAEARAIEIAEQAKTDVITGVQMLIKPILDRFNAKPVVVGDPRVAPLAESPATGAAAERAIVVGDKVKVWIDAAKKTFHLGVVREVHDGGHSFDVELQGGVGTHVQAGGLELDELAQ